MRPGEMSKAAKWKLTQHGITLSKAGAKATTFSDFTSCYRPEDSTALIYDQLVGQTVESCLSGVNGTIFAYGQTGSGKTHTMMGEPGGEPGLIALSLSTIFEHIKSDSSRQYLLRLSVHEIYNEEVRDLLSPENQADLKIVTETNAKSGDVQVKILRLSEEIVTHLDQATSLVNAALGNRSVAATQLNQASSRSHAVFHLVIESTEMGSIGTGSKSEALISELNLVDLAGSERCTQAGTQGKQLREGVNINKSLLTLGAVIAKLSDGGHGHIPFRDSKLTRILQPSLGGNAQTTVICCLSPSAEHADQSIGTLRFAGRAGCITNKAIVNKISLESAMIGRCSYEVEVLQRHLAEFQKSQQSEIDLKETELLQATWRERIDHLESLILRAEHTPERRPVPRSGSRSDRRATWSASKGTVLLPPTPENNSTRGLSKEADATFRNEQASQQRTKILALQTQLDTMHDRSLGQDEEIEALRSTTQEAEASNFSLRDELEAAEGYAGELQAELTAQIDASTAAAAAAGRSGGQQQDVQATLEAQVSQLQHELAQAVEQRTCSNKREAALEGKAQSYKKEVDTLRQQLADAANAAQQDQAALETRRQEQSEQQKTSADLLEQLNSQASRLALGVTRSHLCTLSDSELSAIENAYLTSLQNIAVHRAAAGIECHEKELQARIHSLEKQLAAQDKQGCLSPHSPEVSSA